jgi:hypothetical protein
MRREVIELSFSTVLQDGQVGEMVLAYLRQAAPPDLYKTARGSLSDPVQPFQSEDFTPGMAMQC